MPIYEYRCGTCGRRVELLIRSTMSRALCPECGSRLTDRLFSVPNILRIDTRRPVDHTCCGQEDRCQEVPCSAEGECRCA
jgi:putative FmdB family regulatory protein